MDSLSGRFIQECWHEYIIDSAHRKKNVIVRAKPRPSNPAARKPVSVYVVCVCGCWGVDV